MSADNATANVSFTQKCPEYKYLKELFNTNKICPTDKPSDVKGAHAEFNKFTTTQFRSQFNKLKGVLGINTKAGMKRAKEAEKTSTEDKPQESDDDDDTDDEEILQEIKSKRRKGSYDEEDLPDWIPHSLVTKHEDRNGVWWINIILSLSAGAVVASGEGGKHVTNNGTFAVRHFNNGTAIQITEQWTDLMNDIESLHQMFDKTKDCHTNDEDRILRKIAVNKQVRELRKTKAHPKTGKIRSIHTIKLPFAVDPTATTVNYIGTVNGCRYCHIDLCSKKKVEKNEFMMISTTSPSSSTQEGGSDSFDYF